MTYWKLNIIRPCFGEGDDSGGESDGDGSKVTLTPEQQTHVDSIVAAERRKWQKKAQDAHAQLEDAKGRIKMTADEAKTYQQQLDNLKSEFTTKAERDAEAHQEQIKGLNDQLSAAARSSSDWQNRYGKLKANTLITAAAIDKEAFNPSLIVDILGPKAELTQKHDTDGKPINEWDVKIPMTKVDGETIKQVKVSPAEAVALMVKQPDQYGSLFKSTAKGGTGGTNTPAGGDPGGDPYSPANLELAKKNPEKWRELFAEKENPLGVK